MIKVGFLSPSLRMGGAERWMLGLARHCDPERIQWVGTALTEWSREHPIPTREMARYMPIYGPLVPADSNDHVLDVVRRPGPDASTGIGIVCSQAKVLLTWVDGKLGVMTNYYRQHYNIKVVAVSHSDWAGCCSTIQSDADYLAAVSNAARAGYQNPDRPVEVIYNGIDLERCVPIMGRQKFREKYNIKDSDLVLTYIGRLSREKNCLAAAKVAAYMGGPCLAMYVGGNDNTPGFTDAEWVPEIKKIVGDRFRHVGQINNVGDALAATDVLINCSHNEGFCLGITEAWAAGVPVVATPVGALPELESTYGPLVSPVPRDPNAKEMATAVVRALSHPWRLMIDKAKTVAWNALTTPAMAERWTQYIEKIAG